MRSFVLFLIKYFILNLITLLEKIIKKANKFFSIKFLSVLFYLEKQNKNKLSPSLSPVKMASHV